MKLTFAQKIALLVVLIWEGAAISGIVINDKGFPALLVSVILLPIGFMWITGTLHPVIQWLTSKD